MAHSQSGSGLVKAILGIVIIVAILGGLAVAGFANGNTPLEQAEAAKVQADIAWETQVRHIELPYIQARIEAENKTYLAQLMEQRRMLVERNNQQLLFRERWQIAAVSLVFLLGTVLILTGGATLAKVLLHLADQRLTTQPLSQIPGFDPLREDPEYRRWRIYQARQQEVADRVHMQNNGANGILHRSSNGHTRIRG
jgi:hypothetical protein